MSDTNEQPKASAVLRKIDDQIIEYNKQQSKLKWIEIDKHWKSQAEFKKVTLEKVKSLLSQEELLVLGIITQ